MATTFVEYRKRLGLSLKQCAPQLGLAENSQGHLSRLENDQLPWPIKLALEVEVWSAGEVTALSLLKGTDRELLWRAIAREAAKLESVTAA